MVTVNASLASSQNRVARSMWGGCSVEHYFYPPFFIVPEESSFDGAWEVFCCKMANLMEARTDIYRRTPPEDGIDLYGPTTQTAYQCKSVDSGRSGGFNAAKALESIGSAIAFRPRLPWSVYVLCTNVDVTGAAEEKLRAALVDLELRPRSYWQQACEKHPDAAEPHFRRLVKIPRRRTEEAIADGFVQHYRDELHALLEGETFTIFLYSNRHERIYRVQVSPDFKVEDLVHVFRRYFRLPGSKTIEDAMIRVSLSHSLVFDGKKQAFGRTLRDCGICDRSLVTYWTTITWKELSDDDAVATTMHRANLMRLDERGRSPRERAMDAYKSLISEAFARFDQQLAAGVLSHQDPAPFDE